MKKPSPASQKLDHAYDSLTGLSLEELRKVIVRTSTLMRALGGNPPSKYESDLVDLKEDWLLEGIYQAFTSAGHKFQLIKHADLIELPAYRVYRTHAPAFMTKVEEAFSPRLNMAEKIILGKLLAATFLAYVSERTGGTSVVSLAQLLYRADQFPVALDSAFPGYLDNGMLRMLLKSRATEEG